MSSNRTTAEDYCQEFIDTAKDSRTVWGLWSEAYGWASVDSDDDQDIEVLLFWGDRESAEAHMDDEWREYDLISIPLDEFIEKTLSELQDEGVLIGPNWDADFIGLEVPPNALIAKLPAVSDEE